MAFTFELTARVDAISRGDGRSATAAAAYRACCSIDCERTQRTHDYTRKHGLEAAGIMLPQGAPHWAMNRGKLWNAAEMVERNGKRGKNAGAFKADAQLAREVMFTFPSELSAAGRLQAAQAIAWHLTDRHQVASDFSIHQPGKDGDERNHHCHLMMTTRRLTTAGLGEKVREWSGLHSGKTETRELRAFIAGALNAALKAEGKAELVHVEHRSFADRGMGQRPTQHQGPNRTNIRRKELGLARRAWFQAMQRDQQQQHVKELAGLKLRQDFGLQSRMADIDRRGREGARAIKRELDQARAADRGPEGIRKLFWTVTGRAGREAFDRQAREGQRMAEAREKLASLKQELQIERSTYSTGQTRERAALIERHTGEDRQLYEALRSRIVLDRTAEVVQRREPTQARTQERTQEREPPRQQQQDKGRDRGQEFTMH